MLMNMIKDIPEKKLVAYISKEKDREMNTFFLAAICDDEKNELLKEESNYNREELIEQVTRLYPSIDIQDA